MPDYFLVELAPGPEWDYSRPRREQADWDEHAAFMDELVDEGFVVLGGPVGEGEAGNTLQVVDADTETTVRNRFGEDPWAGRLLTIASVTPWFVWLRATRA